LIKEGTTFDESSNFGSYMALDVPFESYIDVVAQNGQWMTF